MRYHYHYCAETFNAGIVTRIDGIVQMQGPVITHKDLQALKACVLDMGEVELVKLPPGAQWSFTSVTLLAKTDERGNLI